MHYILLLFLHTCLIPLILAALGTHNTSFAFNLKSNLLIFYSSTHLTAMWRLFFSIQHSSFCRSQLLHIRIVEIVKQHLKVILHERSTILWILDISLNNQCTLAEISLKHVHQVPLNGANTLRWQPFGLASFPFALILINWAMAGLESLGLCDEQGGLNDIKTGRCH